MASDPNGDELGYGASGLPPGLTLNATTGAISGTPSAPGNYNVVVAASDGLNSATQAFVWTVTDPAPLQVIPPPPPAAALAGAEVTYTAGATNAINAQYSWQVDDGAATAWSSDPTMTHAFTQPGVHYVTVTVRDDRGVESSHTFVQTVHLPLTALRPAASANIAFESRAQPATRECGSSIRTTTLSACSTQ